MTITEAKKMIKPGHIRIGIDRKIYFEYYKLDKPKKQHFKTYNLEIQEKAFNYAMQQYEASIQLIEVENVFWGQLNSEWVYEDILCYDDRIVKDGEFCKAEITRNTCTIIELN